MSEMNGEGPSSFRSSVHGATGSSSAVMPQGGSDEAIELAQELDDVEVQ